MGQVLQISSRRFTEKPNIYFDLADQGTQIILKRGRKRAYVLTPADGEDDGEKWLTPEMRAIIDQGLQDIKDGKGKKYTLEELKKRMGLEE
jgi:hypothetical protein